MNNEINLKVSCPICTTGMLDIAYFPGDPGIWQRGDGSGEPPMPDSIENLSATCECWTPKRLEQTFDGIEYKQWYCEMRRPYPGQKGIRNPASYQCGVWNRVGQACICGASQPVDALMSTGMDASPLYEALMLIVNGYMCVQNFIKAEKVDAAAMWEHEVVEDATLSSFPRLTCKGLGCKESTCLRHPWMSDAQWEQYKAAWLKGHVN